MPKVTKKALKLSTEIDIHAVSCPGVVLIHRGRLALSLCLLGFHTRTGRVHAKFPLEFEEKFKFDRTFVSVTNLSVLERVLENETVYLELIQEEASGETVLAVFESSVRELLFPRQAERLSYSGNDLDLLMEPTRDFPGIISPKIEISTRTVIGETRAPLHQCSQDNVSFGHSQNKSTKATYRPITDGGKESDVEKEEEENEDIKRETAFASSRRPEQPIRNRGVRPPFAYKRPENRLLSQLPPSPTRNNRSSPKPNLYGSFGSLPKMSKGKNYDDNVSDARVSLVEPERCPHCDGDHGPESCTTCRTYHRYFPRPTHHRPHIHSHAIHAHPHFTEAALKILQQPPYRNRRRRKRYMVDVGSIKELTGSAGSPSRRPSSAPPPRSSAQGSGISADEDEGNEEDQGREGKERKGRLKNKDTKRLSFSGSVSRSPSPPPSHASAPPALSRSRHVDSDDDSWDDCNHYLRRYGRYWYPHHTSPYHYPYDYECPLCNTGSARLPKYYRGSLPDSYWYRYHDYPSRPLYSDSHHSKDNCPVCYKYGLYWPYWSRRSKYCHYPIYHPLRRRYGYLDNLSSRYDSDLDFGTDKKSSKGTKVKFRRKREIVAPESADEILSDVYNNGSSHDEDNH